MIRAGLLLNHRVIDSNPHRNYELEVSLNPDPSCRQTTAKAQVSGFADETAEAPDVSS